MEKEFEKGNIHEQLLNKSESKVKNKVHPYPETKVKPDVKKAASFFQLQYALSKKFDVFLVFLGLIGSIGTGLSMPIFSIIFGGTVNDFGPSAQGDKEKFLVTIEKMCLKFIFVGLGIWFCSFLNIWLWTYNGKTITKRLKKKYFSLLMSQEQGYFDVQDPNEFATKIQHQIKIIEQGVGDKIGNTLMAICMSVSSFVVGFTYSWKLSLILLSVLPILLFCAFLLIQSIRTSDLRKFKAFEKAGGIAEEVLKNIKTVASFANFDYERKRFETKLEESYKSGIRGGMITALSVGFLFFTIFASYSLAIWFGSKLITEGDLNPSTNLPFSAGDVLTVLFTVVFGAMSLGQAAPNLKALSEAMSAAYDFFELMKRVPQIISQSGGSSPDKNSLKGRVEFHDVEFKYPSKIDEFVFKGLNIEIEENKITALVGPSGSGKTTIANLIERLYEISGGKILFDSYDITNLDLNYLRSLIGYVPQEPVLFNTSIRENIIFGRENVTDEMVWEACKQAMADEFIAMKEEGLDYIVGIKGSKLSGGQKQRIAIARAILTKPKILILDEATSALDNKSEKEVQLSLNKVMNGVTTVVIAHRLSTVMNADKIIVLKNGSVVNQGKHRELLDSCEVYNYLVKNQMGKTDLNDEDTNLILLKGKSDNLDLDNVEKEIPRARTQRKSSFQELEERILEEKNKKIQFEKSAANNRSRIIPILCQIKCVIIFAVFFTMIAGAVWPIYGVILADSISQLSNPDKSIVSEDGVKLAIYFLILAASAGVSSFFQNYLFIVIGEHLTKSLRKMVFSKFLRLHMAFFDVKSNTPGYLTTQLSSDTTKTNSVALSMVGSSVQTFSTLVIGVTLGFFYDWRLSLINLGIIPFTLISAGLRFKIEQGYSHHDEVVESTAGSIISESVANTKTIYCYNMQTKVVRMYKRVLKNGFKNINKKSMLNGFLFGMSQFMMYGAYAVIYFAGAHFIYNDTLTMDRMFRAIFSLLFAGFGLGQAQQYVANISQAQAALVNIFRTIDEKSLIDPSDKTPPNLKTEIKGKIEFRNVSFKYSDQGIDVLKNINFTILPGQKVAFVGKSGSGKSTIIQLIERFYDVTEGEILIDDENIRNYDLTYLRQNMSCVLQEPVLFQGSISDNIRYGKLEASEEEVLVSAQKAKIEHKLVGNSDINVSGGEKQRLAIARAIINKPKILLLDEFTSALNSNLEKEILDTMKEMLKTNDKSDESNQINQSVQNVTTITVAHRLSTIENSDLIFVMDEGKIIETGSHLELLNSKGSYFKLYNMGLTEFTK